VEEGESVEAGELLVSFEQKTAQAESQSLTTIRQKLKAENRFYRSQLQGIATEEPENVEISPELVTLTDNRASLVAENRYYRATLQGEGSAANLTPQQLNRFQADQTESESRVEVTRLEAEQLRQQLTQVRGQLANAQDILQVNQKILDRIAPLVKEGAVSELQFLRQQQEVGTAVSEVNRLREEEKRLQYGITQSQERLRNTVATSDTDIYSKISDNDKRIADIDSQLSKVILENEKRLEEVDSQISQIEQTLVYQELRAPVSGKVFDLQATGPGFVVKSSEPLLKIVPQDNLIAKVYITNQDIGFVEENMTVDVRIDSFPYSEFGDIKGKLVRIGSDALPPNEVYPFHRFPAEIRLEQQALNMADGKPIELQSGMSVNANIKLRKRRVITIFTDLFIRKVDSLQSSS
ncbi:MAG: HlyD family efflux transporter periplasmic adaptor subunit, partial [Spirulinaceae cyanobacterium]